MAYLVVEAYKSITEFFVALSGWLYCQNKIVYYPRIDLKEELSNVSSTYAQDWIPRVLKKVWHSSLTFDHAESMVDFHSTNNSGASSEEASEPDNITSRLKKSLMPAPKSLPRTKRYSLMKPIVEPPDSSLSTLPPPTKIMRISEQPEVELVPDETYDNSQPVCISEHEFDKESGKVLQGGFIGCFIQTAADGNTILVPPDNEMVSDSTVTTQPVIPPQQDHQQNQHMPNINVPDETETNSDDLIF